MKLICTLYLQYTFLGKAGEGGGMGVDSINTVFHHLEAAEETGDTWPQRKQV